MKQVKQVSISMLLGLILCLAAWAQQAQQGSAPQNKPAPSPPPKLAVKVGDAAPDFTLRSHEGKDVKLSDFKGKKNVILAFYVFAFTGGWTKELSAYQADIAKFEAMDTQVLGISMDSVPANKVYAAQLGVTFPLLCDWKREVVRQYGVYNENTVSIYRSTIVVDKNGIIQNIQQGNEAVDITGAREFCTKLHAPKS